MDQLLSLLTNSYKVMKRHNLDRKLISQIYHQTFYYISSFYMNKVVSTKKLYNFLHITRSSYQVFCINILSVHPISHYFVRVQFKQLEQWARDFDLKDNGIKVTASLQQLTPAS